jgi:hypothetical protein
VTGKPPPSSAFRGVGVQQRQNQGQDALMSSTPASPPSSSEDSPTTSGGDNFLHEDTEMLDYDDFSHTLNPTMLVLNDESSPEALFLGNLNRHSAPMSSRFVSQTSPQDAFSPFNSGFDPLRPTQSSPEFDPDGDSPGLGSDMRGLRINSRYPSPVQGTVRLEDVMLPTDDTLPNFLPTSQLISGSLFESKPEVEHIEQGLFQPYTAIAPWLMCRPPYELTLIGIPPSGAKSRVETQIKLDLQLSHPGTNELVKDAYDFIKLPSYGVSKEKFRLANLKGILILLNLLRLDGPREVDPQRVLNLEASVICTSQPTKTVFICEGCILREVPPINILY